MPGEAERKQNNLDGRRCEMFHSHIEKEHQGNTINEAKLYSKS